MLERKSVSLCLCEWCYISISCLNKLRSQMIKGSRWFQKRLQGVTGERGKTGAEEGKACPQAVNGRKPSVWGSRDDFQGKYDFVIFV